MSYLNTVLDFLCCEYSFTICCRFEGEEMLQLRMKTYELSFVFAELFDS